jgi:aminoglycoside phosphotransferase (APT) family kinase protein
VEHVETTVISIEGFPTAQDCVEIRSEDTWELTDTLVQSRRERKDFLQTLAERYQLMLQDRIDPVPSMISFTSHKGILYGLDGTAYLVKQRPDNSLQGPQLFHAAHLQMVLSEHLPYVPPVIRTREGSAYAYVHNAIYFLTPYISGEYYIGRREQSLAAASALGEMHALALRLLPPAPLAAASQKETSGFFKLVEQFDFSDKQLHQRVIEQMKEVLYSIMEPDTSINGWLHGDFAPFNLVFRQDTVIAVNDFDNVMYGPLGRDVAECVLTHCGMCYTDTASLMRPPIQTTLDASRARGMISAYMQSSGVPLEACANLASQIVSLWFELLVVGLLRGDLSLEDVNDAFAYWIRLQHKVSEVLAWL